MITLFLFWAFFAIESRSQARRDETKPTLETEKLRRDAVRRRRCTQGSFIPKGKGSRPVEPRLEAPSSSPRPSHSGYRRLCAGGGGFGQEKTGLVTCFRSIEFGKVESVYGGPRGQVMW